MWGSNPQIRTPKNHNSYSFKIPTHTLSPYFHIAHTLSTYLHIASTTVYLLLVLDSELHHQRLLLIGKLVKGSRHGIELGILGGLQTFEEKKGKSFKK